MAYVIAFYLESGLIKSTRLERLPGRRGEEVARLPLRGIGNASESGHEIHKVALFRKYALELNERAKWRGTRYHFDSADDWRSLCGH